MLKSKRLRVLCAVIGVLGASNMALATDPVTLPDLGVDVAGTATAMGTDLGEVFMAVLLVSTVFIVGMIGWRWFRRAGA